MLSKITIRNVASYSSNPPITIENLNKKVNLFFGLNGAGKSTIGNYLQSPSNPKYIGCSVEPSQSEFEILVYNQNFINDNFYQKSNQNGIFTVGEDNKETQEEIEQKLSELDELRSKINQISLDGKENNRLVEKAQDELRSQVWKTKDNSKELGFCYSGKNTKAKFLEEVLKNKEEPTKSIKELISLASGLSDDTLPKPLHSELSFTAHSVESDPILNQSIIGSSDSYLSSMVERLSNSDWVKKGIVYLESDDNCPFCQQKLPDNFRIDLEKLFDHSYEEKIQEIRILKEQYTSSINEIDTAVLTLKNFGDGELDALLELLDNTLKKNISSIETKISNPSLAVELIDTKELIDKINVKISEYNAEIREFNSRLDDKEKHKREIKIEYWRNIYAINKSAIELCDSQTNSLEETISNLRVEYQAKSKEKSKVQEELTELQERTSTAQASITAINNQLKSLGLTSFSIVPSEEDAGLYKISRPESEEEDVYSTLSEGEKTLIAFLYFVESCFGSRTKDEATVLSNRIVVIDDPISSLSHNFVFDIASIIHHKIISNDFLQVFVLTHNMYFFHELLLLKSPNQSNNIKDYNLFRVSKSEFTSVSVMSRNSLQNDYQTYWQIIKDCRDGLASTNMLPNAMRNILEHYFNFVHNKGQLRTVLEELGEEIVEFKPFFRFVSRMSHSDSVNLFDTGAMSKEKYLETFEEIFRRTGFHEHYTHMMTD